MKAIKSQKIHPALHCKWIKPIQGQNRISHSVKCQSIPQLHLDKIGLFTWHHIERKSSPQLHLDKNLKMDYLPDTPFQTKKTTTAFENKFQNWIICLTPHLNLRQPATVLEHKCQNRTIYLHHISNQASQHLHSDKSWKVGLFTWHHTLNQANWQLHSNESGRIG